MKKSIHWRAVAALVCVTLLSATIATAGQKRADPEVIVEWNALIQRYSTGQPFSQIRGYAMMHIAMADSVIAVEGKFDPFMIKARAPSGACAEIAAAQAAHDVFYFVIASPEGRAAADALLKTRVDAYQPSEIASGIRLGQKVAAEVIAARLNDGYALANPQPPTLAASTLPGIWRPTPSGAYQFSNIGVVQPFGLVSPTQFLPVPFPQLESQIYADNFNEVKAKGRAAGGPIAPDRTEAQGRFAQLFASSPGTPYANATNPLRLWSNVTRDMARLHRLSLVGTARLFAMSTVSSHDSLQTSQYSKEIYRLWRPETAIANADIDNNPNTEAEKDWRPHVVTPPYPAYASNMTCIGAGTSRMLANLLGGDAQTFSATWYLADGTPVWTEPYTSLWQLGDDEANSRIWGGIHFRIDIDSAQVSCVQVADYLSENFMRRARH